MPRCAVVSNADLVVVNVIVADAATDPPQDGCFLVDIENFPMTGIDWVYDPVMVDFVPPASAEVPDGN